jgi:hypothetical protein
MRVVAADACNGACDFSDCLGKLFRALVDFSRAGVKDGSDCSTEMPIGSFPQLVGCPARVPAKQNRRTERRSGFRVGTGEGVTRDQEFVSALHTKHFDPDQVFRNDDCMSAVASKGVQLL